MRRLNRGVKSRKVSDAAAPPAHSCSLKQASPLLRPRQRRSSHLLDVNSKQSTQQHRNIANRITPPIAHYSFYLIQVQVHMCVGQEQSCDCYRATSSIDGSSKPTLNDCELPRRTTDPYHQYNSHTSCEITTTMKSSGL